MAHIMMKIETNVSEFSETVSAMSEYLEAAQDDDPVKLAMAEFGKIESEKHLNFTTELKEGIIHVRMSFAPELQQIFDMIVR